MRGHPGVYGYSTGGSEGTAGVSIGSGVGVYGLSSGNNGVYGYGAFNGVYGEGTASNGAGVEGYSGIGYGLYGDSEASNGSAVVAISSNTSTYLFQALNFTTYSSCIINSYADLSCTGTIVGGSAPRTRHHASTGQRVLTYASQSTTETVEDVGTARMVDGVANVPIAPDFASVIDRNTDYYVFLTPLGDTRGLYVSMKASAGFQVRETLHGRSSLAFDYRIVARPIDSSGERLPLAPRMRRPHVSLQHPPRPQLPPLQKAN